MLYQNTRNRIDTYTAHRVLHREATIGEGRILPMTLPAFDEVNLQQVLSLPFAETVSEILNVFFPGKITALDISFALGKAPARVDAIGQKVLMGVLWDNQSHSAEHLINTINDKLCGETQKPTTWTRIAIQIAVLFGLFADLKRQGVEQADVAVAASDMETAFAVWYARKMGLPVGTIICVCNENSNCWDFLRRGSLNTGAQTVNTSLPEMDVQLPLHLETLLFATLGRSAVEEYVNAVNNVGIYSLDEEQLPVVNDGIYACVVGSNRVADVISSVAKTDRYALDGYAAAVYGGVQDYRAKTGKNSYTLVWADHSPR